MLMVVLMKDNEYRHRRRDGGDGDFGQLFNFDAMQIGDRILYMIGILTLGLAPFR